MCGSTYVGVGLTVDVAVEASVGGQVGVGKGLGEGIQSIDVEDGGVNGSNASARSIVGHTAHVLLQAETAMPLTCVVASLITKISLLSVTVAMVVLVETLLSFAAAASMFHTAGLADLRLDVLGRRGCVTSSPLLALPMTSPRPGL